MFKPYGIVIKFPYLMQINLNWFFIERVYNGLLNHLVTLFWLLRVGVLFTDNPFREWHSCACLSFDKSLTGKGETNTLVDK